jgi:hypothetical protein
MNYRYKGYKNALTMLLLVILIVLFNSWNKNTDGFTNNSNVSDNVKKWSADLIKRFNIYQTTMNNNANQFDLELLQQQATPEEAEELLKTGYWPWSDNLKQQYLDKVWTNTMIKIDPQYALNYAMGLYNKRAVTELLAWNTKEGQFLLYGGLTEEQDLTKEQKNNRNNTIKCNADGQMEKKVFKGMNLWNGTMESKVTIVKPEDIPKEMPGFTFIKGACNPCSVFNDNRDFTCPFKLNVEGDDSVSDVWQELWKL